MQLISGMMFLLALAMIAVPGAQGAPALSDCRALAKICLEPNQTRRINGQDVHAACWKWQDTYDCARPAPVSTDCAALQGAPSCSRTSQSCISSREGVCERYRARMHCTARPADAGAAQLVQQSYRIRSERWVSQCTDRQARQDCRQTAQSCSQGAQTRNINGLDVSRDCWQMRRTYECLDAAMGDDCGALRQDPGCRLEATGCLARAADGSCVNEERVYSCGADSPGSVSRSCGSAAWCVGGRCTDIARQPASQSFGRAAAGMNLLQEMGRDFAFDGSDLAIFRGEKMSCSKWIGGLKNCCKSRGLLIDRDLAQCSEAEKKLAARRSARLTWHAGSRCKSKTFFGLCTVRAEDHCVFASRLGRMLQEQARGQLGIARQDCRGLSIAEIERVDWSRIDLSEALGDIETRMQPMEAARIRNAMKTRIDAYYRRIRSGTTPPDNSTGGP